VHRVDVSDRAQLESFAAAVEAAHGRVDVRVDDAGVTVAASFEERNAERRLITSEASVIDVLEWIDPTVPSRVIAWAHLERG
jgi:NAD(P)-dependent dehydrogenase (short-subunit alcohol dehydrogenase family)